MNWCLDESALDRLLRGSAPRWRAWLWRGHLKRCPLCRARYAECEDDHRLVAEFRGALEHDPTSPDAREGSP